MEVLGFEYIGVVCNQVKGGECDSPSTRNYLIEIAGLAGFFFIGVHEDDEQALIGAEIAFSIDWNTNQINKYRIMGYKDMSSEELEIPEWKKGPRSKMNINQRIEEHKEWLKSIHQELKDKIFKGKEIEKPEELIGGFDD